MQLLTRLEIRYNIINRFILINGGTALSNNKKIETLGVSYLASFINKHELLQTYFDSNDKTPAWDGEIHILKSASERKSDILGKVPVQIKTTTKKVNELISFQLQVNDLKLYLKTGGVVLFVVWLDEHNNLRKIFYKSLPPFTIKKLLKRSNSKSTITPLKKITIQIHELETKILYPMLCDFTNNSGKQFSFVNSGGLSNANLPDYKGLKFYHYGESPLGVFDYQRQHDLFIYVVDKETGLEIPVEETIEVFEMFTDTNLTLSIGDSYKFENITRHYFSNGNVELHAGNGFKLTCNEKEGKFNLNYNRPNLLSEAIYCTRSLIELKEKEYIKLNESKVQFDRKTLQSLEKINLEIHLEELLKISQFLEKLDIKKDIDLSLFDESSKKNFDSLYRGFILKEEIKSSFNESKLLHLKVADAHIITLFQFVKSGLGIMIDIFNETPWCRVEDSEGDRDISIFEAFETNDWLKIDNCNFDSVIASFQRLVDNNLNYESANDTIIKIISASDLADDKSRKNLLLEWAQRLSNWNMEYFGNTEFAIINDLQIKSRIRDLNDFEFKTLSEIMINNNGNNEVCFGASVLLGSKPQASLYWNYLDEETREKYEKYPIYKLFEQI